MLLGECPAEQLHCVPPAFFPRQVAGDRMLTRAPAALTGGGQQVEKLVQAERSFRRTAKVSLVTRQNGPLRCLSLSPA